MAEELDFLEVETPENHRLSFVSPGSKWSLIIVILLAVLVCLIGGAFLTLERRIAANTELVVALLETQGSQIIPSQATVIATETAVAFNTPISQPSAPPAPTAEITVETGETTGESSTPTATALARPTPPTVFGGSSIEIDLRPYGGGNTTAKWTVIRPPTQGILTPSASGLYLYRALTGYVGVDFFTYELCINDGCEEKDFIIVIAAQPAQPAQPTALNATPVADDDIIVVGEDDERTDITAQLLQGDSDAEGSTLRIVEVEAASLERVVFSADTGKVFYDPGDFYQYLAAGDTEVDIFQYTIEDSSGGRSTASATVEIQGRNDIPVANNDPGGTGQTAFTVNEGGDSAELTSSLLSNDVDPDRIHQAQLRIHGVNNDGAGGNVSGGHGALRYHTNGAYDSLRDNQTVTDTFTYTIIDPDGAVSNEATAQITIQGVSDPPTMTISNPASPIIFSPTVSTTTSIPIATAVSIVDVDSTSFQKLIVQFSGLYDRRDGQSEYVLLTFQGNQYITTFNYVVVQLQPNTLSNFRAAVQSAVYVNTKTQPTPGCRQIDFELTDESGKVSDLESVYIQVGASSCPAQSQTAVPGFPPFSNEVYHDRIWLRKEVV